MTKKKELTFFIMIFGMKIQMKKKKEFTVTYLAIHRIRTFLEL
jgi:hypothetical protein